MPQCAENKAGVTQTCNHTITGTWMPVQPDGTYSAEQLFGPLVILYWNYVLF